MNLPKEDNSVTVNPDGTVKLNRLRRYYPVPLMLPSTFEYQDVGKNMSLRNEITDFYRKKIIEWINTDKGFVRHKKHLAFIKSHEGRTYVYTLLRVYVKKGKANWYDLRDNLNYSILKDFFKYKIGAV
jgi:hypothetical protein